jgi:hypothetical protein
VTEARVGYGYAIRRGLAEARAPWIVIAYADDSYDLTALDPFIGALGQGADLVIGSRLRGTIRSGAMPWLHRWIGNPVLSWVLRVLFFGRGVSDAHCGLRALTACAADRMRLRSGGMELASEMVIKAVLARMRVAEVPITLHPAGRQGRSHLRPFRDGWRHLRLMLLLAPTPLFLVPGALCMIGGLVPLAVLGRGPVGIGRMSFDVHVLILGRLLTILGFQIVTTGLFAKAYAHAIHLYAPGRTVSVLLRAFTLERGLLVGVGLFLLGLGQDAAILARWLESRLGSLDAVRPAIQASTAMIVGLQAVFSSFFLALLRWAPPER